MARESRFQADLISELHDLFPGCIVLKNDAKLYSGVSGFNSSVSRQVGGLRM